MKIRYEVTMDDLVAFNLYHHEHSPALRRARLLRLGVIVVAVTGLFVFGVTQVVFGHLDEDPQQTAFVGGVLAVTFVFSATCLVISWLRYPAAVARQVKKLYKEGKMDGMIGHHEMELTAAALIERNTYGESTRAFEGIEKVVSTPEHTFIYLAAMSAHVLPRSGVTEGDYDVFVEALQQRTKMVRGATITSIRA